MGGLNDKEINQTYVKVNFGCEIGDIFHILTSYDLLINVA